jgi:hypothetical protein
MVHHDEIEMDHHSRCLKSLLEFESRFASDSTNSPESVQQTEMYIQDYRLLVV